MTTFEDAARAEAERARGERDEEYLYSLTVPELEMYERGHLAGSSWARDHLAEQEPSDAEVEAAAQAIDPAPWRSGHPASLARRDAIRDHARAALRAAARIRKEQER